MEYREPSLDPVHRIRLALDRLTLVRAAPRGDASARDRREATLFYPLVGLVIGLLPALALLLPLADGARAVLAVALWTVAAGAGHLRAWTGAVESAAPADAADDDGTRVDPAASPTEARFGAAGTAALVLALLAKAAALVHVPWFAPLAAAAVARWGMVHALRTYSPARGADPELAGAVPLWGATWVAVAVLGILTFASPDPGTTALAVTVGTVASLVAAALFADRFRGATWGACAASAEAAEVAALWAFLA